MAALVPLCAVLCMTSRGAVLSVQRLVIGSLALAAVLFVWFARELVWRKRWWAIASAFSTAAPMFALIIALGPYVRFARLVRREVTYRGDQIRIASVRAGVEAALLHPILGPGIGRYFPREGAVPIAAVDQRRALGSPDSLPLLAFGEMGLFAMLLVLVLMLKPPIELFRFCSRARDERARWTLSALACGALALPHRLAISCVLFEALSALRASRASCACGAAPRGADPFGMAFSAYRRWRMNKRVERNSANAA